MIREKPMYLSTEVWYYLRQIAKAAVEGTDASMTVDQVADNMLRKAISEQFPELIELYGERQKANDAIEQKMRRAVRQEVGA